MNNIEQIWREYAAALHGFIQSRVDDADIADDILQNVFLNIHAKIDSLKDTAKLRSWIYQIARNAVIDHYRSLKTHSELPESIEQPEEDNAETARQEIESCMLPLIRNLPDNYREAVMLSEIEGMTQKQVAEKLGLSLPAAKSRVLRGRIMVKNMLNDCCQFEIDHRGTMVDYDLKDSVDKNYCQ
jgi:RNA polymerase sigma-70 factor (ECF subfamily)